MKTVDFSETIAASDLKGSRSRHLIEVMKYVSIEGQGHSFTIHFPGFVCFVLYWAKISGERLQDHWSSGFHSVLLSQFLPSEKRIVVTKLFFLTQGINFHESRNKAFIMFY